MITRQQANRDGYTIVEMAIVLCVLGMLLGSVLYPLGTRLESERVARNAKLLVDAEEAIIGYALSHNTSSARVDTATVPVRSAPIPAGRPYLPCPDLTGDGIEDRIAPNFSSTSPASEVGSGVTLTLVDSSTGVALHRPALATPSARYTLRIDSVSANNELASINAVGGCYSDKGILPWTTLGLPPTDVWGNLITYRVDPIWANSILGFGAESRIDKTDSRFPLSVANNTVFYTNRDETNVQTVSVGIGSNKITTYVSSLPGVVCTEGSTVIITPGCTSTVINSPGREYFVNDFNNVAFTLYDVFPQITIARRHNNGVADGMAFVLVSHGQNGYGAFRYQRNFTGGDICDLKREGIPGITDYDIDYVEVENYDFYSASCRVPDVNAAEDRSSSFIIKKHSDHISRTHFLNPRNASKPAFFDDDLRFMTGTQVLGVLRGRGHDLSGVWIPPGPF